MTDVTVDRDKLIALFGEQAKTQAISTTQAVMEGVTEALKLAARENISIWEVIVEMPDLKDGLVKQLSEVFDANWTKDVEAQLSNMTNKKPED